MLAKYGCLSNKMVNLFYQWTPSEEVPGLPTERDGKGWRGFQSRDTLRLTVDDAQTMDNTWYVHIYAEDGEGEKLFTVHSGAFLLEGESREGDYLYKIKSYTDGHEYAVITKYIGNETELAIPDTLGGKTVKEIGKEAFNHGAVTDRCKRKHRQPLRQSGTKGLAYNISGRRLKRSQFCQPNRMAMNGPCLKAAIPLDTPWMTQRR